MSLLINGERPNKIIYKTNNAEEEIFIYKKNGEAIWGARIPFEIIQPIYTRITITKTSVVCNESALGETNNSGYIYAFDGYKIIGNDSTNYAIDYIIEKRIYENTTQTIKHPLPVGVNNYIKTDTPISLFKGTVETGRLLKIEYTAEERAKLWHTVYSGKHKFDVSHDNTNYITSSFRFEGFKNLRDHEATRITGGLYLTTSYGSPGKLEEEIRTNGDQIKKVTAANKRLTQYLTIIERGLESRVQGYKFSIGKYFYYWEITKVEQYY